MSRFLCLVLMIVFSSVLIAQSTIRTDTVQRGYYIPPDSNVLSFKLSIVEPKKPSVHVDIRGNSLPDSMIYRICRLPISAVIIYSEITILRNGKMEKADAVRYVIGATNSKKAKPDPSAPTGISAEALSDIELDTATIKFEFGYMLKGTYYTYELKGNHLSELTREKARSLPPGTKVYIEGIQQRFPDGSIHRMPTRVFVVK